MSLTASVVILVVWIARGFLWKAPKKYMYVLWLIVGIRLLCPVGIASPFSIYNFINNESVQIEQYKNTKQGIDRNYDDANHDTYQNKKNDVRAASNNSAKNNIETARDNTAKTQRVSSSNSVKNKTSENITSEINLFIKIGSYVWVSVFIMIALWNIYLMFRMKRKVSSAVRFKENIYECENIPAPFVMGLISPKIYIPFRLGEEEQSYIIRHEKYHIKRKDNVIKFIAFFICCVYWFHPLVWISYLLMVRDMEMSCDEYVLQKSPEDIRAAYSESLLGFALNKRNFGAGFLAFGESDTERRVKHVMKFRGYGKWIGTLAMLLVVAVGIGCLTNESKNDSGAKLKSNKLDDSAGFHLTEISKIKGNFSIPDPEKAEETAEVVLHKCKYKEWENNLYCVDQKDEPAYDLSFLGLKNPVYVTNFAIGNVTGEEDCLVLALEEKYENEDDSENYAYLAVLDYKNKKSYLTKTDVIAGQGRDEQINLCDITGNGRKELIFSSEPNMVVIWNLYQFTGNKLKKIYSNNETAELERDGFKIELLDDYKMKITGRKFDYEQTISLLDLGYQKEDLEYVDPNNLDKSENEGRRAFKNGKLMKEDEDSSWRIQIRALMAENWTKNYDEYSYVGNYAEYNYFKEIDTEQGMGIPLSVVLGDEEIGKLYIYLKYDAETDEMKIAQVEFIKIPYLSEEGSKETAENVDKNMYTDEELEKMASDFYYKENHARPPIVEVDSESEGVVTIHLYEINEKAGLTFTWNWYYIDRATGKGKDLFDKYVDLTQALSNTRIEDIEDKNILKVLKNEKVYYNTEFQKELYLKDYSSRNAVYWQNEKGKCTYSNDSSKGNFEINHWCEVDMDGDGNKEIILELAGEKELVLHSEHDKVYVWAFRFRSMKNIKTDGTFESSGSAADIEIWKLKFADGECYCQEMCIDDELEKGKEIYRINAKTSTRRKVKEYLEKQNQKEDVEWVKY